MKWNLGALKILARNPTIPRIALQDTIEEIERLIKTLDAIQKMAADDIQNDRIAKDSNVHQIEATARRAIQKLKEGM